MSELPERIGAYKVIRKLGEGGMGIVYAALGEKLNREVAVKTIRDVGADSQERVWREARSVAAVNHPGVCQIYEIAEDADQVFLVMELLEGQPLSEVLEQRGPQSAIDALAVASRARGAPGAACERDRATGSQAVECLRHAARGQVARFWPGPVDG
jgi:serine/threonine protein kinase